MSISYQPKDDKVLSVALKTQELVVRLSDSIVSVSGLDVTVDVGTFVVVDDTLEELLLFVRWAMERASANFA